MRYRTFGDTYVNRWYSEAGGTITTNTSTLVAITYGSGNKIVVEGTGLSANINGITWSTLSVLTYLGPDDSVLAILDDIATVPPGTQDNPLLRALDHAAVDAFGGASDDFINGTLFNDTLRGGAGADEIEGRDGDDTFLIGAGEWVSPGSGPRGDVIKGGSGTDTVQLDNAGVIDVRESLHSVERLKFNSGSSAVTMDAFFSHVLIIGGSAGDEIRMNDSRGGDFSAFQFQNWTGKIFLTYGFGGAGGSLVGTSQDDVILQPGVTQSPTLSGGMGSDTYYISNSFTRVVELSGAGSGTDTVYASVNWTLEAGSHVENIIANAGSTGLTLSGNELINTVRGGAGNDQLFGGGGDDSLFGGAGADQLDGGAGFDYARYDSATAGVAVFTFQPASNTGEAAGDSYVGIEGFVGSNFADTIIGDEGVNVLIGLNGHDVLFGAGGFDSLLGANGEDSLFGGTAGDYLDGGLGFDYARYDFALAGVTVNLSNPGANTGEAAGDVFVGIEGLTGTNFGDGLAGDAQANVLFGWSGADTLVGFANIDALFGGDGNDTLFGGTEQDFHFGQGGADVFVFQGLSEAFTGVDSLQDFASGVDKIALSSAGFGVGSINFVTGPGATAAAPQFIYNPTTRTLLFDPDGTGAGSTAVPILTLQAGATLVASDLALF
jgi:Ca2+-binding RTX toxin-like protein